MTFNRGLVFLILLFSLAGHANESCGRLFYSEWASKRDLFKKKSKVEQVEFLKSYSNELEAYIKSRVKKPAVHFNLHGGTIEQYLEASGIRASRGDIAVQYGSTGDLRDKVYFFNLHHFSLYEVLTTRNPSIPLFKTRMGSVMILFNLANTEIGHIEENQISVTFSDPKTTQFQGIPLSAFVTQPLPVFETPRGLSYNEKTYWALTVLDDALALSQIDTSNSMTHD